MVFRNQKPKQRSPAQRVLQCLSINTIKNNNGNGNHIRRGPKVIKPKKTLQQQPRVHVHSPVASLAISPLTTDTMDRDLSSISSSTDPTPTTQNAVLLEADATPVVSNKKEPCVAAEEPQEQQQVSDLVVSNAPNDHVHDAPLQKLQSVQSDLRKAVHALVSLRAKSEDVFHVHQSAHQMDTRKDIKTVQGSVTLAKEQVDELCTTWDKYHHGKDGPPNPFTPLSNHVMKSLDLEPTTPQEENPDHAAGTANVKEVLMLRKERDALCRHNNKLVATLNSLLVKQEQDEEEEQESSRGGDTSNQRTAYLSVQDSKIFLTADRESLSKAVQSLTATLTCLMEERDRLSVEYQSATQTLREATELAEQLGTENEELVAALRGQRVQLDTVTSDQKIVASHGRVVSASLVFVRNELATAHQRIRELEVRLSQAKSATPTTVDEKYFT